MSPSTAVADVLVAELVRQRVRHVVLAPGSRSAPLAFAVMAAAQRGELGLHVRIDERVAAFTALGLAKATGPVVIVTTSGTAVANLHPAVLEASHSGVPLVVLTADRPHEMRGTGANQTTDQVRIFGNAVRFFVDVPAPHGRAGEDADARNLLGRALAAATGVRSGDPGPVHLNLSFREPLVPDVADAGVRSAGAAPEAEQPGSPPPPGASQVREVRAAVTPEDAGRRVWAPADAHVLAPGVETVVIAGDGAGQAARQCAEAGGFPLLAEPSSGARSGPNALVAYRLLLSWPDLGGRVRRAVVFGHPTLSRPVDALLARRDVEVIVVAPSGTWPDAARNAAYVVGFVTVGSETGGSSASDRGAAGRVAAGEVLDGRDSAAKADAIGDDWLKGWQEADRTAQRVVGDVLEAGPLTGPLVAREVWAAVRPGEVLVVGSSNAIRDLDLTASPFGAAQPLTEESGRGVAADELGPAVYSNRGLAGIDGTVSTAAGVALGSGETTRVLLGDLAFLHDIGGLLIGPHEEEPRLQIVVLNDDGGGIFTLLEHGAPAYADVFERVFGTPHGADLAALCRGYGVRHSRIDDFDELRSALSAPVSGRSVIEVTLDRSSHRDLHGQIRAFVEDAIGE